MAKPHSRTICYTILQLVNALSHPSHHPRISLPEPLPTSGQIRQLVSRLQKAGPLFPIISFPSDLQRLQRSTLWTPSYRSTCSGSRFSLGENLHYSSFITKSAWLSKLTHKNASQQLCPSLLLLHLIGFVLSGHSGLYSLSPPWQQVSAPVSKAVSSQWSSPHFSFSFFFAWSMALCFVLTNAFPWQRLLNIEYTSQHLLQFNNECFFFFWTLKLTSPATSTAFAASIFGSQRPQ